MSVYIIDSNFFIQAHRANYPLDVAFSFWNKIKQLADAEKIISIDKVKQEIYPYEDALKRWCEKNLPESFFHDTKQVLDNYKEIVTWAASRSTHYLPNTLAEFFDADEADAWLVAYALADKIQRHIVTNEVSEPHRKNKIKIPDVCFAHGVQCCNTIEMFRQLGETF